MIRFTPIKKQKSKTVCYNNILKHGVANEENLFAHSL